ncbi:unnamed protein product [Meganyctiphanes norvegica]|uniref:Peptidase S1 domain-containing protein n=1 Tax=Meganyctiphanes norvegica TaxID=48144 RepID=A0AAV2S6P4_MEGNR
MRTARLASILLLASGSVIGLPQYSQDNTDDSGDGSISGNFWWQQGNAFEGSSGTNVQEQLGNIFNQVVNAFNTSVAQVTSQVTSGSYNTPVQSEYCAVGQGCVPWQLCPNAIITQGANVVSGTPYPADAAFTGCGDVTGNVCCGIPTDVLDQQQHDTNAPNIYDTCSAGLDCVTIDKCNLYTGFIEPQVETYSGQAFVEYNRCTGSGAIENVCCQAKPSGQQNLGAGSYSTPAPLNAQCASNQDCVPYFQCANGVINTDGAGLLDLRVKPRATCSHPDYPDVPAICCNIPGAPEPIVSSTYAPTPAPISSSSYAPVSVVPATSSTCSGYKECVPSSLCDASGNIVTDGADLIDLRIVHKGCLIDGTAPGVCCTPPGAPTPSPIPQINICPKQSTCIEPSLCRGEALQDAVADSWNAYSTNGNIFTQCTIGSVYSGVCCINPAPQIDSCPGLSSCIEPSLCKGEALQDAVADSWTSYAPTGNIFTECTVGAAYTGGPGVCCINPAAPITAVEVCPDYNECVPQNLCDQNGNINTDGSGIIDVRRKQIACYTDLATYETGVCCKPPGPPPLPVVDTCPGVSTCVPDLLCSGQVLNSNGDMIAYNPGGSWSQCPMGGGGVMGVCCIPPPPVYSTVAPIIAADQCGRRNQEEVLNTRIQSVIAKNEAQFGEFPWQAIIFFSNYTFKCGASLIGDRWLLTGGHCVNGFQPNDIQIRLGEWQVNSFDEPLPYTDVQVKSITVHPDFNPKNVKNNIAVVELAEPVEIQYHINSICLPAPGDTFWNQRCFVTGWGKDSFEGNYQHILKKIDLPMVDKSTCQALLRKTRLGKWFFLDSSFICAGGEENKDACKGDGGGPLACEDPNVPGRYVLAGMTSWGIGCGNKDVPGVYADVQGFSEWIQGVIGGTLAQQQQVVGPEVETGSNPYGK